MSQRVFIITLFIVTFLCLLTTSSLSKNTIKLYDEEFDLYNTNIPDEDDDVIKCNEFKTEYNCNLHEDKCTWFSKSSTCATRPLMDLFEEDNDELATINWANEKIKTFKPFPHIPLQNSGWTLPTSRSAYVGTPSMSSLEEISQYNKNELQGNTFQQTKLNNDMKKLTPITKATLPQYNLSTAFEEEQSIIQPSSRLKSINFRPLKPVTGVTDSRFSATYAETHHDIFDEDNIIDELQFRVPKYSKPAKWYYFSPDSPIHKIKADMQAAERAGMD